MFRVDIRIAVAFLLLLISSCAIARDPTQPPNAADIAVHTDSAQNDDNDDNNLILTGIVITKKNRLALINNAAYEVGDRIQDLTIIAITKDHVTFKNHDITFKMPIRVYSSTNIAIKPSKKQWKHR